MEFRAKLGSIRTLKLLVLIGVATVVVGGIYWTLRKPSPLQPLVSGAKTPTPPGAPIAAVTPAAHSVSVTMAGTFQLRPFPVARETATAQWTQADGKDTNVIRQLAHNPLEYARMVDENDRIFRRQLVYLKTTAAAVFEAAKLTGKSITELTLPGLDGQELPFQIVRSDDNESSRHGTFSGHLAGNLDSLVTFAFQDGREAFTVISPNDHLFLVGEPREDGQVIVKAIDPNTYGMAQEGGEDFIPTTAAKK